jgi:small subunit ribosomal protein S16
MVAIRLMRTGKRGQPVYRIVVQDERRKLRGAVLETLGTYDPKAPAGGVTLNLERVEAWRARGAGITPRVRALVRRARAAAAA